MAGNGIAAPDAIISNSSSFPSGELIEQVAHPERVLHDVEKGWLGVKSGHGFYDDYAAPKPA